MKFKVGDFVLISHGNGYYVVRKIEDIVPGGFNIGSGYYKTFYKDYDVHKCPKSISNKIKER